MSYMKTLSDKLKRTIAPQVALGMITGVITGFLIYFYNLLAHETAVFSAEIYKSVRERLEYLPLLIAGVAAAAVAIGFIIKKIPAARGSGIPYAEGVVRGKFKPKWYLVLPAMFFGSLLSSFIGLSLGMEGPSILLGCMTGYGIARLFKRNMMDKRLIATAGACGAFAVAFNAPLSGILFSVEEAHRRTSPAIIIPVISAVLASLLTVNFVFGEKVFLNYTNLEMPVTAANISGGAVVGVLCGLFAMLFAYLITHKVKLFSRIKVQFRVLIPAALCVVIGLLLPEAMGTGHGILTNIALYGTGSLALLFAVKFLFTLASTRSGASGGVFIPMLAIGALIGAFVSRVMTEMGITNNIIYLSLMGAAAFFAAAVRAPFTAVVLIFEITAYSLKPVMGVVVAVGAAYLIAELFRSKPLYEIILDSILAKGTPDDKVPMTEFSVIITINSPSDGRALRDIVMPSNCLIVKNIRNSCAFVPDGETVIKSGDELIIACESGYADEVKKEIATLF